ncbi:type II toxin-antitoxin system PemK/MazF family toxin [Candidatus Daviesbacteria bacterium]|nr:type II toxin-antitoxin system PemK/MazF family toxin [Candidatus Daviesbacteria bacterium]
MKNLLTNYPKRGEIFIADLNPPFGREIHKKRPVLVISNNILNQVLPTVIIIPFSSIVPEFIGPDMVKVNKQKGLDKSSTLIANQMRAIDRERLVKRSGKLSKMDLEQVEEAMKIVLDLKEI